MTIMEGFLVILIGVAFAGGLYLGRKDIARQLEAEIEKLEIHGADDLRSVVVRLRALL